MTDQTHLSREIMEQPDVIGRFLDLELDSVRALAKAVRARHIDHVVIAGRGTSDNAGRYGKYVFGALDGLQVALATPSLFSIYEHPIQFGNALVLGISQSGRSPDIVSVLAEARRQGKLTAAITNSPDSPLAAQADFVIELHAGDEKAVAATKTYTSSLAAIAALSSALSDDQHRLEELMQIPEAMSLALSHQDVVEQIAPRYRYMKHCVVIGRGYNFATAFELALKLKELTYTIVEPYSSADFLHGPFAILEPGFPVMVVAPSGRMSVEIVDFVHKVRERGAEVLSITDQNDISSLSHFSLPLQVTVPEWLSPLVTILPGQQFAMALAATQGNNVDAPRAIRKVTETT